MAQPKDQVFQLSLTEIAFTIAFLLLLLLGYMIFKEESERKVAQAALANIQSKEQVTRAIEQATRDLVLALGNGQSGDPNKIITQLVESASVRSDRDRLKQKVDDLNAKLTALTELQERLQKTAAADKSRITKEAVTTALALQHEVHEAYSVELGNAAPGSAASIPVPVNIKKKETSSNSTRTDLPSEAQANPIDTLPLVRQAIAVTRALQHELKKQLNGELTAGDEVRQMRDLVAAMGVQTKFAEKGANVGSVIKENSDLRGQVAFLKHRLDARGGRDFPPCWADETGKVEFLFALDIKPEAISITPAWPTRREESARSLPGIDVALSSAHLHRDFAQAIKGIFDWSRQQNPECRHYVQLKSLITDAVQSDRARLMIENFFYKVEVRR